MGVTMLRPLDKVTDDQDTQLVLGSYRIHQNNDNYVATDLHYTVGTDTARFPLIGKAACLARNKS